MRFRRYYAPARRCLVNVLVDGAYSGDVVAQASSQTGVSVTMVKRPDVKGFVVVPKRWIVERSFGWMNRDRRLSKDYERTVESSEAWIQLSFVARMARRLAGDSSRPAVARMRHPAEPT
jgi:putative transposase